MPKQTGRNTLLVFIPGVNAFGTMISGSVWAIVTVIEAVAWHPNVSVAVT